MHDQKIIVCTTFRDFKGNKNDEIQRLFLKSLESQKYTNFELVVTLFGEKEVEKELKKYNFKSFVIGGDSKNFRYSLTKVVVNAINYAEDNVGENYIVLWTTCDVVFDKTFLNTIIQNYKKNCIGTSHPHMVCSSVNDFNIGRCYAGRLFDGFDLIYFDSEFLKNKKVCNALKEYVYNDWGVFEHFLISLAEFSHKVVMINLYEEAKINKIENDRQLTNEPSQFLVESHNRNSLTFLEFLSQNDLSKNYFDLTYCHLKFRQVKNAFFHNLSFRNDIVSCFVRLLKNSISRVMPVVVKKAVRSIKDL